MATACASAANAMGDAVRTIQHNDADVMITGGTEAAITPMSIAGFSNMKALSERNDAPEKASRPFDKDRDGFVLSEGAGLLVFEELEHAKRRGAKIYAEVLGYGASADGGHITQPDEHGTGAAKAMEIALADAKLNPAEIGYINAHGTSTPLGDAAETRAIKRIFGDHARQSEHLQHEKPDRPSAGRQWRRRADLHRAGASEQHDPAHHQSGYPRSGLRFGLHSQSTARAQAESRHEQ